MCKKYFYIVFLKRDNKRSVIIFNRNLTKVWCIKNIYVFMYIFVLLLHLLFYKVSFQSVILKHLFSVLINQYVHFSHIIYAINEAQINTNVIKLFYMVVYIFYFRKCLKFYERVNWKCEYFFNIQLARFLLLSKFRCYFSKSSRMFRSKRKSMKATPRKAVKGREQEI